MGQPCPVALLRKPGGGGGVAGNIIVPLQMENRLGVGVGHQHIPGLASSSFHPWG